MLIVSANYQVFFIPNLFILITIYILYRTPPKKVDVTEETELQRLMKKVGKRNLDPSNPSHEEEKIKTDLVRTNSLAKPNTSKSTNESVGTPITFLPTKSSDVRKASSFRVQPLTNLTNNASITQNNEAFNKDNIREDVDDGSELKQKLKLRKEAIYNTKISDASLSRSQHTNTFNSLPPINSSNRINEVDQEIPSSEDDSVENQYVRVAKPHIPPSLPEKGKNFLPLPPKNIDNVDNNEDHYAVPKRVTTQTPANNKYKRRSLTKPQVPNKPITLRKPPIVAKPAALRLDTNTGATSKNRTACKAVLHTNAANKTHLKLFQPVNDAHSRIKGN